MTGKYFILAFLSLHALIHLMGFVKAMNPESLPALPFPISLFKGIFWLVTALVLFFAAILLWKNIDFWWMIALFGVLLSSWLIYDYGEPAKFGWIPNILLILAIVIGWGHYHYSHMYQQDVKSNLALKKSNLPTRQMNELPLPVQKYLNFCSVNKGHMPTHVFFKMYGRMQDGKGGWFDFTSEQYDFFKPYARLFFMEGKMKGLKVPGYHRWSDGKGSMDVSVFGLIPVIHYEGQMMDQSDAVTLLNDICLLAPAALLDPILKWQSINELQVRVFFPYPGGEISAVLFFDPEGKLVNFISEDRYDVAKGKKFRFSTPVTAYTRINGINVVKSADAIWHYPEGDFTYAEFNLIDIQINPAVFLRK